MIDMLERINGFVWGIPALLLILGVGLWFSFKTGFLQIRWLPKALKRFFGLLKCGRNTDGISPYQALCTALAATVGTGNIAGVAGALAIGGPGAVFWMWICGVLGMMIKFAEATLAVRFRQKNQAGEWVGGPMYMIQNGLHSRWRFLAVVYSFFGVVAAFGAGNATQINAVVEGINSALTSFGGQPTFRRNLLIGLAMGAVIVAMLMGGAKRIGAIAERLVPFACVLYMILGLGVLILRADAIPHAFSCIFRGAFEPKAVTGGAIGSAFLTLRTGASRGVFTNEAGMGTACIAHAPAQVDHPVQQGLMGIMEVFLDTIVICTMTALVILCSGAEIPYGSATGTALTANAFTAVYGSWTQIVLTLCLCLFAFATVLGWGLYGIRCAQYLFGDKALKPLAWLQGATVVLGAVMGTGPVWLFAETVNGLMAIPNLIALALLTSELLRLIKQYKK